MTTCNCEHWQVCPTCKPDMFDDEGNRLTFHGPEGPSWNRELVFLLQIGAHKYWTLAETS